MKRQEAKLSQLTEAMWELRGAEVTPDELVRFVDEVHVKGGTSIVYGTIAIDVKEAATALHTFHIHAEDAANADEDDSERVSSARMAGFSFAMLLLLLPVPADYSAFEVADIDEELKAEPQLRDAFMAGFRQVMQSMTEPSENGTVPIELRKQQMLRSTGFIQLLSLHMLSLQSAMVH